MYRTRSRAGVDSSFSFPRFLAVPTLKPYQYATSFHQEGLAYLQGGVNSHSLFFQNGSLFFRDPSSSSVRLVSDLELTQNFSSLLSLSNFSGLGLLSFFYSFFLKVYQQNGGVIPQIFRFYLPDLALALGYKRYHLNDLTIRSILRKLAAFNSVIGVINEAHHKSYYAIFQLRQYDSLSNTIELSCPYFSKVIDMISSSSLVKGAAKPAPSHSFLLFSSISSVPNQFALEIVMVVTRLIEQAGSHTPRISLASLLDRCVLLRSKLNLALPKHRNLIFKRALKKAWSLLRSSSRLLLFYPNILLPDPDDPSSLPSLNDLDHVFRFCHDGKKIL